MPHLAILAWSKSYLDDPWGCLVAELPPVAFFGSRFDGGLPDMIAKYNVYKLTEDKYYYRSFLSSCTYEPCFIAVDESI